MLKFENVRISMLQSGSLCEEKGRSALVLLERSILLFSFRY